MRSRGEWVALAVLAAVLAAMFLAPAPNGHANPGRGWFRCVDPASHHQVWCAPLHP